ncbi:MAG: peptidase T [Bacteroidota bacterium]
MFDSNYKFTVTERFLQYVQVDTQSDPNSDSHPSTEKQKDLSGILVAELSGLGMSDVSTDEYGYVYATIPSNTEKNVPVICFCSHVDTAPDCSGKNVKPIVHTNYQGGDIKLPDDPTQVLNPSTYPYLSRHIGKNIITASGLTLLGADDKSGVAIIIDLCHYLLTHPGVKHGTIKILFTPDEEVGRGTAKLDLQKLAADFAYTLDGGEVGDLEDETFSANGVELIVHGVSAHPGYAKGKMVNALKVAGAILAELPKNDWCPEATDGKQGFIHPVEMNGIAEKATIRFIIRDFITANLSAHETRLEKHAAQILQKFPGASMEFKVQEQYRNMKEVLDQYPHVIGFAKQAIEMAGLSWRMESIRGGTDGSRLSFMGLPCPNLFTGMQGIHSKTEWIGISDMQKSVETLVNLVQVWEKQS